MLRFVLLFARLFAFPTNNLYACCFATTTAAAADVNIVVVVVVVVVISIAACFIVATYVVAIQIILHVSHNFYGHRSFCYI